MVGRTGYPEEKKETQPKSTTLHKTLTQNGPWT